MTRPIAVSEVPAAQQSRSHARGIALLPSFLDRQIELIAPKIIVALEHRSPAAPARGHADRPDARTSLSSQHG
jgi:hypothetical protein